MTEDWKKTIPFTRHLTTYLAYKLIVLAIAVLIGLRFMGWI